VFHSDNKVAVHWPEDFGEEAPVTIRVQDPAGFIYGEVKTLARASACAVLGNAHEFPNGAYDLVLMPGLEARVGLAA